MTTTKIPTFPTPADITTAVTNISPDRARYRAIWQAADEALNLATPAENPLDALTYAATTTGDIPTPEALLQAAEATPALERDRAHAIAQLEAIKRRYVTPPDTTSDQAADVLDYLASAIKQIITAVRALPDDVPLTAEAALDRDNGAELYRTARALTAAYDAVRSQQRRAVERIASTAVTTSTWTAMVAHSGMFKDSTEHDAHWLSIRRAQFKQYRSGLEQYRDAGKDNGAHDYFAATPDTDPWPTMPERSTWPTGHDTDEKRTRWLIRAARDLEPWIPSFDELTTEHDNNISRTSIAAWTGATTRRAWMIDRFGERRTIETTSVVGIRTSQRTTR